MKCRLLSLNPETLWFRDEGETNEGDHIAVAPQTAEDDVDFRAIFGEEKELSRKEIQERCKPLGYDERTIAPGNGRSRVSPTWYAKCYRAAIT